MLRHGLLGQGHPNSLSLAVSGSCISRIQKHGLGQNHPNSFSAACFLQSRVKDTKNWTEQEAPEFSFQLMLSCGKDTQSWAGPEPSELSFCGNLVSKDTYRHGLGRSHTDIFGIVWQPRGKDPDTLAGVEPAEFSL